MIPNKWFDDLVGLGYSGTLNDMMYRWLGSKGYTGTIDDRMSSWLSDSGYHGVLGEKLAKAIRGGFIPSLISNTTLTRPSAAWAWGSDQLLDEYAADGLRRDYDPATGVFRGVLVEKSRTNELLDNRDLSTGNWSSTSNINISRDETGIDGEPNTASMLDDVSSGGVENVNQSIVISDNSNPNTLRVSVKKDSNENRFPAFQLRLSGGTTAVNHVVSLNTKTGATDDIQSDGIASVSDSGDWWRVTISVTNNSSGNTDCSVFVYPARGNTLGGTDSSATGSIVFDFGQVELNTDTPSSPIETDGTATTRAADVLEGAFNKSSGTLHFVAEAGVIDGGTELWRCDDGGDNNRIRFYINSSLDLSLNIRESGADQDLVALVSMPSDGKYNIAMRYDGNDVAVAVNGTVVYTSGSSVIPTVTTQRFGRNSVVTTGLNWYKTANYRETKLTDSDLEALTS